MSRFDQGTIKIPAFTLRGYICDVILLTVLLLCKEGILKNNLKDLC